MQTLILVRHGEAAPAGGGSDSDRALTAKGERDASAAGRALARLEVRVDHALVSPARRTQQTWAAAAPALGAPPAETTKALLHTDAETIQAAAEATGVERVMVVGHNPGIAELVDALARLSPHGEAHTAFAKIGFPPASAAVFQRTEAGWRFDAFLPPESRA